MLMDVDPSTVDINIGIGPPGPPGSWDFSDSQPSLSPQHYEAASTLKQPKNDSKTDPTVQRACRITQIPRVASHDCLFIEILQASIIISQGATSYIDAASRFCSALSKTYLGLLDWPYRRPMKQAIPRRLSATSPPRRCQRSSPVP